MINPIKKVFLIILDGFGLAPASDSNPVTMAKMPYLNSLIAQYPSFAVEASGLVVGLPWGKPGNSEVGHSAIGTGRVIIQDWARINTEIKSGVFFENPALQQAIAHCRTHNSRMHFVGCTSPGGIHGHEDHLIALLRLAAKEQIQSYVHMITDGEDAGLRESLATLQRLAEPLLESKAKIATVMGRTYGMDRVFNWTLTEQAWQAMTEGKGEPISDIEAYLKGCHDKEVFDDIIPPAVVHENGAPVAVVAPGDAVIFFNYRNDRSKQLLASFTQDAFTGFQRPLIADIFTVTMTRYSNQIPVNAVAYEPVDIHHTLGKEISQRGLRQFRIAEQEKGAHINNFFNGGRVDAYEGTEQIIVPSRQLKGVEYMAHPAMSASSIVAELLVRVPKNFALYVANFANSDMMGHTGNLEATVKGLNVIDESLEKIATAVLAHPDFALVITCDHGNGEEVIDPATGGPDTQHSTNNVIAVFAAQELKHDPDGRSLDALAAEQPIGSLIDIAPTILKLLEFEKPSEMTGTSLL